MRIKFILLVILSCFSIAPLFAATTQEDNKILSWLIVLNKNEISVGKETLKRSDNKDVKKYASQLVQDHTSNLRTTEQFNERLAKHLVKAPAVMDLKEEGAEGLKALKKVDKKDYDSLFIDDMIKGHTAALKAIDDEYMKEVDGKLKEHLELTRNVVHHHLQEAEALKQMMHS